MRFLDKNIPFKSKKVDLTFQIYEKTLLPSEVEISESGMCNRKCSFCPRSDPDYNHVNEFISDKLHNKLVNELKIIGYKGTIRYSGFVEPLLDKNIYKLINDFRKNLPEVNIELVTNGDPLNEKNLIKLYKSGLNKLLISVYDGPEDAEKFKKLQNKFNLNSEKFFIRERFYDESKDFGITLSNRAGAMEKAEFKIMKLKEPLKRPCYYPSYTFFLDYNGDVLMCPHDWLKKYVVGNLFNQTFMEIWESQKFKFARMKLIKSDRQFSPCNVCDVSGDLIGKKHAKYWKNSLK